MYGTTACDGMGSACASVACGGAPARGPARSGRRPCRRGRWAGTLADDRRTLGELDQFPAALDAADTAITRDPDDALGYTVRSVALACLDRYAEAYQAAERALALDPAQAR